LLGFTHCPERDVKSVCVSVFLLRFTHIYSDCDTSRSCIHWRNSQTEVCDKLLFTGETVKLKCVINSYHSDWRYEWYKDKGRGRAISRTYDRYTVNGDTLSIDKVITSDQGQYSCKGHIDGRSVSSRESSAVSLSVKGEFNIIVLLKGHETSLFQLKSSSQSF